MSVTNPSEIQKCEKCNKFFDASNNNFFMNLAISKFKENSKVPRELLRKLHQQVTKSSHLDWCTCYTEEKINAVGTANKHFEEDFLGTEKTLDIKNIGLDFTINKNILYIQNNKFSQSDFLHYCKSTKQKLTNSIFDFDFLTYDKINDEKFMQNYKKYIVKPNFLVIMDLHQIKENQINELKNLVSIIRERLSNNKKIFILLNQDFENFVKTIKANNWASNELIYTELVNLISENFVKKLITISNRENVIKINTLDYEISKTKKGQAKKISDLKKGKEGEGAEPQKRGNDFDDFD